MNIDDLMQRTTDLIMRFSMPGSEGVDGMKEEADGLVRELLEVAKLLPESKELEDLSHALQMSVKMYCELKEDPKLASEMGELIGKSIEPNPPVFDAIDDCDLEAVKRCLKDMHINDRFGEFDSTALYHAMSNMFGVSLEIVNYLLDEGADPKKGLTTTNVLHGLGFAELSDVNPVELSRVILRCVELGADIEQPSDNLRWTPLIGATTEWNSVAVEALLLAGADITAKADHENAIDCFTYAEGHEPTMAVLKLYSKAN